jgi:NAD(P)-dependent dehydrogenase (short-subunit alcohol dehydrogenase family)
MARPEVVISTVSAAALAAYLTYKLMRPGNKLAPLDEQDPTFEARPSPKRRCILVTGAASGIGKQTALLFLKRGWFVGCFDIDSEALEAEFGALVVRNEACVGYLDVSSAASCSQAVELFLASTGGFMDALFNCAGLLAMGRFEELDLERQIRQVDVNCSGVVKLTYKSIPALIKTRGRVVTMASVSSVAGIPFHAVYAATKAFVYSLTEALRSEFASHGVLFCDVAAPYVATPMTASQAHKGGIFEDKGAFITPEEVAEKVWNAVHVVGPYREHFYVGRGTETMFKVTAFSRLFGLGLHTDLINQSQGLPRL